MNFSQDLSKGSRSPEGNTYDVSLALPKIVRLRSVRPDCRVLRKRHNWKRHIRRRTWRVSGQALQDYTGVRQLCRGQL